MITTNDSGPGVVQRILADKPSFHSGGEANWHSLPETLEAIRAAVKPGDATLETGLGASTVVFAACGASHTAISPAAAEHERVREYCRQIGVDADRVTFIDGLSDDVLPTLLGGERTLDVAFIDGAHSFPFPEVDWHYITRSLKIGGKLLMDDVPIPAVAPLFRHMTLEPNWRLDGVLDDRACIFTLLAPPAPEDWTGQPFNRRYPDYGFVELPSKVKLHARHRAGLLRSGAARRYPALNRAYKKAAEGFAHRRQTRG
jgi:hypothetical protein